MTEYVEPSTKKLELLTKVAEAFLKSPLAATSKVTLSLKWKTIGDPFYATQEIVPEIDVTLEPIK